MGKGDIKTKRGKIARGSFGNSRPKKVIKATAAVAEAPKAVKETKAKKAKK